MHLFGKFSTVTGVASSRCRITKQRLPAPGKGSEQEEGRTMKTIRSRQRFALTSKAQIIFHPGVQTQINGGFSPGVTRSDTWRPRRLLDNHCCHSPWRKRHPTWPQKLYKFAPERKTPSYISFTFALWSFLGWIFFQWFLSYIYCWGVTTNIDAITTLIQIVTQLSQNPEQPIRRMCW